ncbi:P-loop NTPase fold protein [Winogradskyella sp.]|jgi:hypothetical protein|uniref:P-loop NTPase fold protein n=1 Tax=Winogradskyella sp. TaxID=1883156 RepID=UPI0025F1B181|nr:P-loop NTPase fold protein [Winogradskyella sp.]MCT4628824.1 KAP family NTPase [Winogradskyella sp.]
MESKKIEAIFDSYLTKEKTSYAILISGKWGSGKTHLWKNPLEEIAKKKGFDPIYISLNGIESIKEIEGTIFSRLLPFSDTLENKGVKNVLKALNNLVNVGGKIFGRGTQLTDLTKGININLDVSKKVFCFDDLERCPVDSANILGLINEYTEHKNTKVIICSAEEEIKEKNSYDRIKEKVVGRVLYYTANYDELFKGYVKKIKEEDFKKFLNSKKETIINFFKRHKIENLRTFIFYLENVKQVYKLYADEEDISVDRMLFFTAIISTEFKKGRLTISDLDDNKGIDGFAMFIDFGASLNNNFGKPIIGAEPEVEKEKSYKDEFIEEYLGSENEKNMYSFSTTIYEFILTGYLNEENLKSEIDRNNGKIEGAEEYKPFNSLMGYNFRILENEEFEKNLIDVLDYAEKGIYDIYDYQPLFNNYKYFIKIGALNMSQEELTAKLHKGLEIANQKCEINFGKYRQIEGIRVFKGDEALNEIDVKILELHDEKNKQLKKENANRIFDIISLDYDEVDDFLKETLNRENGLFQFINGKDFFDSLIKLKNKNILTFSNALVDIYKKTYISEPNKELPFFKTLHENITAYIKSNELKNPNKIILEELIIRLDEIIQSFEH